MTHIDILFVIGNRLVPFREGSPRQKILDIGELDFNLNLQRNANVKGMSQGLMEVYNLRNYVKKNKSKLYHK